MNIRAGFRITDKKGFHITFENGWTVSVQFGPANYCDHYGRRIGHDEEACGSEGSTNAECAVWSPDWVMVSPNGRLSDTVSNRSTQPKSLRF